MNWRIKGILQKALDYFPGGMRINRLMQGTFGALKNVEKEVDNKFLNDWMVFASHLSELGVDPEGLVLLEIGTGWYPTLPICFSLVGVKSIHTYDLSQHLDSDLTFRMLRRLEVHLPAMAIATGMPLHSLRSKYSRICGARTLQQVLDLANIIYHCPADVAHSGLPDESVDLVFSNSVLEHVTTSALLPIMNECRRILQPSGYAIHSICCADHYFFFDKNISQVNYLKYSNRRWRMWNNSHNFQNRLRPCDFIALSELAGMRTVFRKSQPRPEILEALKSMAIASEFQQYSHADLASISVDFAAVKNPSPTPFISCTTK